MVDISAFSMTLAAHAPDVADTVLDNATLRAAIRFCNATGVWRHTMDVTRARPGVRIIDADTPLSSDISSVVEVRVDGKGMHLAGDEIVFLDNHARRPSRVYGEGRELIFDGVFGGGERIEARLTLAPRLGAGSLPDILGGQWRDAILAGALAEVFRYYDTNARNESLANMHEQRFEEFIARARGRARSGNTHARRVAVYGGL